MTSRKKKRKKTAAVSPVKRKAALPDDDARLDFRNQRSSSEGVSRRTHPSKRKKAK